MEVFRLLVADDHAFFRDALIALLEEEAAETAVVGQAGTGN